jgi:hypothetical protein
LGIEEMELPRARVREKAATVGDRGVDSVTSDDRRACDPPKVGPAVLAVPEPLKTLDRACGCVGDSARGEPGFESNRIVLGIDMNSSWAMMMRQSRGNSRSISGRGPSWPLPRESEAP